MTFMRGSGIKNNMLPIFFFVRYLGYLDKLHKYVGVAGKELQKK